MPNHNLPNLKRLWYCNHAHAKTGGCACKNHADKTPKCETILNTPLERIDQIRAEKRKLRLPRPRSLWADLERFSSGMAQYQAQMRMARHDREMWVDTDYERRMMAYRKEEIAMLYGRPLQYMITIDEAHMFWPSVYEKKHRPTEGAPSVPKSWHKFIEPNHRKKPR